MSDPAFDTLSSATQIAWLQDWKTLGLKWARIDLPWSSIQPTQGGAYQWQLFDTAINNITAQGLNVDVILEKPPLWAEASNCPTTTNWCPPASNTAFAAFARAVAVHYGSKLGAIEVWNEQNLPRFWWPTPSAATYTNLLQLSYAAIKSVLPGVTVISGGLSPNSTSVGYLKSMYAAGAKDSMDAVGFHPYSFPYTPSEVSPYSGWSMLSDDSTSVRSVMTASGDSAKQVWLTEVGAPTGGPGTESTCTNPNPGISDHVDQCRQADILSQIITKAKAYPWAGPTFFYQYKDLGTDRSNSENFFGVLDTIGAHKSGYAAIKNALNP